ncbi:phosphoadenosine phosphosulfate reductase family protein [Paenibacillus hubeiensis]|uniref:phosphoadenosine phosphosulfate reductase family protein n=1 Tax=Paenibacillus hubeiensis TaxID=3077330 RepID=UPI0031BB0BC9
MSTMTLFEINENNELVLSCKGPVGESHFRFSAPLGYTPSNQMPELSCAEWIEKVQAAAEGGDISEGLAEKILASLARMPDLEPGQKACISFSNGKDSEAQFILAAMKYPKHRLMALFADTDDEWPETYDFQPVFESWIGVPITTLQSEGIHHLLRHRMPFWPMMGRRHCTKNCKMIPQRDYLDAEGYDQIRMQGRAKQPPKAKFRNGQVIEVKHPAPLMLCGERWSESINRSTLPHDSRDDVILRNTHRPVLEFTIEEVWEFIFWMKAPYNQVYHFVKRCACAGCPFASTREIETLGEYHPDKLDEWCETEEYVNHPWKGIGFNTIRKKLIQEGRFGMKKRKKSA